MGSLQCGVVNLGKSILFLEGLGLDCVLFWEVVGLKLVLRLWEVNGGECEPL